MARLTNFHRQHGVVVAGLVWPFMSAMKTFPAARCSRARCRRPCSASASSPDTVPPFSCGDRSGSPRPRAALSGGASAATRRLASSSLPPLLPLFPSSLLPAAALIGKGKTPSGLVDCPQETGSVARCTRSVKVAQGQKMPRRTRIGWSGGIGDVAGFHWSPPCLSHHRQGQKGHSPPTDQPSARVCSARRGSSCVPARARLSHHAHQHGQHRAARSQGREKVRKKRIESNSDEAKELP
jgi:hypothetical protein